MMFRPTLRAFHPLTVAAFSSPSVGGDLDRVFVPAREDVVAAPVPTPAHRALGSHWVREQAGDGRMRLALRWSSASEG